MKFDRSLNQVCTVWVKLADDGYGGWSYDAPTTITCRWEDKNELFVNPQGEQVTSASVIYMTTGLTVGDMLCLGDSSAVTDPTSLDNTFRINGIGQTTDLRSVTSLYKVFL